MTDVSEDRIAKITDSINRETLALTPVSPKDGGVQALNYNQMLDLAKTMSTATAAIPPHLRGKPGDCLAIWDLAMNTGLAPYQLAQHCYLVNGMLAYDSAVIGAIVAKHAPIQHRLRCRFDGEGDKRTCTVWSTFIGEAEVAEYTTPESGTIPPKNSPLWKTDPDQQLFYFARRRWAKRYCPDILMGVFSQDELEDSPVIKDVTPATPALLDRLPGKIEGEGFTLDAMSIAAEEEAALARAAEMAEAKKVEKREQKELAAHLASKKKTGKGKTASVKP